ncbi:MAG: hypothetical protein HY782_11515 [Chloroflexi bacterium]|nr:hypothetical protein [Chloroflexota bacterium]
MEARQIIVSPTGPSNSGPVPVNRSLVIRTPTTYEIRNGETRLVPSACEEFSSQQALAVWTERLAPSIARALPSPEHTFTPLSVTVERDEFYRQEVPDGQAHWASDLGTRRVRVVRRRVVMFGMVRG